MASTIRLATEDDAEQILSIYAPLVTGTAITFAATPPTVAEMRRRVAATLKRWPWLVCDDGGAVRGYAYAGPHRQRAAYQWSVEVSVYVGEGARRSGVGRALYASLFAILQLQGYVNVYAGVTLPNAASVGLHEAMGFEPVGVYRHVGYKLGAWRDVGWWQLALQDRAAPPAPPVDLPVARTSAGWDDALKAGLPFLRR